jgi:hypothetical protein
MADKSDAQTMSGMSPHPAMIARKVRRRPLRFLAWLLVLALFAGLFSLLSYSLAGPELVRSDNPELAAWWDAHQFYLMEGAATAFGLLLGICTAAGLIADSDQRSRTGLAAVAFGMIVVAPLTRICSRAGRLGWNGRGASVSSWIISREGYETGRQIDKVALAAIYFLKTAAFAVLCGLGIVVMACVTVLIATSSTIERRQV